MELIKNIIIIIKTIKKNKKAKIWIRQTFTFLYKNARFRLPLTLPSLKASKRTAKTIRLMAKVNPMKMLKICCDQMMVAEIITEINLNINPRLVFIVQM